MRKKQNADVKPEGRKRKSETRLVRWFGIEIEPQKKKRRTESDKS